MKHWADGGPTTLDNLVLVCPYHHRLIHHTEWAVHMDNGLPVFTPPPWLQGAA
ncbi:HNH endonuclease [Labedaea rhizosphaerae]|uniref:HNH endonuclease n=1 Tax=Labedaea rhizosphaerae TaxID=598644 RepID=UPI003C7A407B